MSEKSRPHESIEKFGWQPGDLKHSRNDRPHIWADLPRETKKRFEMMGYVNGILPEWDSLTDEQKIRFAPYRDYYDEPAD